MTEKINYGNNLVSVTVEQISFQRSSERPNRVPFLEVSEQGIPEGGGRDIPEGSLDVSFCPLSFETPGPKNIKERSRC